MTKNRLYCGRAAILSVLCFNPLWVWASFSLSEYLSLHTPLAESQVFSPRLSGILGLTQVGYQSSFTSAAPVTLSNVVVGYYSDTGCLTNTSSTTISGPASLSGTTYVTSDQSNFALCSRYTGGCNQLLSDAQSGGAKSVRFTFNFTSGVSSTSECMYNPAQGYEVLADYSSPSTPQACSTSRCGYSRAYASSKLSAPTISNDTTLNGYLRSSDGGIQCWGVGTAGQIGNGASSDVNVPTSVTMPSDVTAFGSVSTNSNFSCAIASQGSNAGKVYCWGTGTAGRIGNGANSNVNVPTSVTMPSDVTAFGSVSTNRLFSCAIASQGSNAGKVYCWGTGANGRIGNGANSNVNVSTSVTMPSGVTAFGSVSTNINFSCAIASQGSNAGKVYCWGVGTSGQIGNGVNLDVNVPTSVTMPSDVTAFGSVSTNINFSCAIASQGSNAGKVYCWGTGTSGQIGNGASSNVNVPTSVTMPSDVTAFGSVSTNIFFSCAIASQGSNAGKVYCWGTGANGEIGNGANSNVNVPTSVTMPSDVTAFGSVSTNASFSCAIASQGGNAGKVYCWGFGTAGRIGNGASSDVNVPTSVTMPSDVTAFGSVSTNSNFSCAIASQGSNAGKVYCWGLGTNGQIGNGASLSVNVPTATS
jgi:alpha-tubulin suppressor-like RCC1 family protein